MTVINGTRPAGTGYYQSGCWHQPIDGRTYTVSSKLDPGTYRPGPTGAAPESGVLYGIAHDADDPAALGMAVALVGYHARLGARRFGVEASRDAVASGDARYFSKLAAVITAAGLSVVYLQPHHADVEPLLAHHDAAINTFDCFWFEGLRCRFTKASIADGIRMQCGDIAKEVLRILTLRSDVAVYAALSRVGQRLSRTGAAINHRQFIRGVMMYWLLGDLRYDGRALLKRFAELTDRYNTVLANTMRAERPDVTFVGQAHMRSVADLVGVPYCNTLRHEVDGQGHARLLPATVLQESPVSPALQDCGHRFGLRAADVASISNVIMSFLSRHAIAMDIEVAFQRCLQRDPLWLDRCHYMAMSVCASSLRGGAANVGMMTLAHLIPTTLDRQSLKVAAALNALDV